MNPEFYRRAYALLMQHGGASRSMADEFVRYFTTKVSDHYAIVPYPYHLEWRFQGNLGFGGKFWRRGDQHDVSCYPEDLDPKREQILATINEALIKLATECPPRSST